MKYEQEIIDWATERGLIGYTGCPKSQLLKCMEEFGELVSAYLRGNEDKVIDGFGDTIVTLIIAHEMLIGGGIEDSLEFAYNTIKSRSGEMINGTFVKHGESEV